MTVELDKQTGRRKCRGARKARRKMKIEVEKKTEK
jgi:hypothetical protein